MSFEAITSITQAEEAAKVAVQYAEAQAKQMLADAEAAGKAEIEANIKKAESELVKLREKADEKSAEAAGILGGRVADRKSALREAAQAKLDDAAALVVERIVKG